MVLVPVAVVSAVIAAPAASAEDDAVGLTPAMGWSSWSFLRHGPTEANIEAEADAMATSGLAKVGYQYVNLDDFWYVCPGSEGPAVDAYGRWVPNATTFPPASATENGIQAVATYVHSLGLKFGLYVTPGISKQAVAANTPVLGPNGQPSGYTADEIASTSKTENNYNCGGMDYLDTQSSNPDLLTTGAQDFLDSWADEFASWGVDYLKLDGVGSFDVADVAGWSQALQQTGRPIHLELSNSLNINYASTWEQYANGWRTGGDIECYGCETDGSSYPLTDYANVESRFNQVAAWQPYGEPGAFNDYDSIEVGNGSNDGLTVPARETQLSLWALASSPLILGTDLTNLDPTDLSLLENTAVIAVDQDAIDASRIAETSTSQIFAKTEKNEDVIVGLFNTTNEPETISTTASALGLPTGYTAYQLDDLWAGTSTETAGTIEASVAPEGVALYRVTPINNPTAAAPSVSLGLSGLSSTLPASQPTTVTASFTDNGVLPAQGVDLSLSAPAGWTVTPTSATNFGAVESAQTVQTSFQVTPPAPPSGQLFSSGDLTAGANYTWHGKYQLSTSVTGTATVASPVQAPYETFSSATDASAAFAQSGLQFGISGAGADLYNDADAYSTVYLPGSMALTGTVETEVTSQQAMTGFAKAGIILRNSMTGSGTSPEGVVLFESPSGGFQLEWDNNGGDNINSVTPSNGTNPESLPVYLMLQRTSSTYTGYYSYDGSNWTKVGSAMVPDQAATQDAGMFVTSHATGSPGTVTFDGFSVSSSVTRPSPATQYLASSSANTLAGGAVVQTCSTCYGGNKVGFVGEGGTLTFNNLSVPTAGNYDLTIVYCDGSAAAGSAGRPGMISVNGGAAQTLQFSATGSYTTVGTMTITVPLNAGDNTVEFGDPSAYTPDFNAIVVGASPAT